MEKIRRAVGAVIIRKPDQILLVKKVRTEDVDFRQKDILPEWDIPKGGIHEGESFLFALKRELKEEVGTSDFILIRKLPFELCFTFPVGKRYDRQITELGLLFGLDNAYVSRTNEIAEVSWFGFENAKQIVTYPSTKELIDKVKILVRTIHVDRFSEK